MDHLPLPKNAVKLGIQIPYISSIEYDGQDFDTFPLRHGYSYSDRGFLQSQGSDFDLCAFYQSWLYFGLMQEVFGCAIDQKSFVRTGGDGTTKIIDSTVLRARLRIWQRLSSWGPWQAEVTDRAISQCAYLDNNDALNSMPSAPWVEMLLSVKILIGSIVNAGPLFMRSHIGTPSTVRPPWISASDLDNPTCSIISSHMIQNSWCPFRARHVLSGSLYDVAYYLACLPPNEGRPANHNECLAKKSCTGDSVDDSKPLKPCHTDICDGNCSEVAPNMKEVAAILNQGKVPLFACSRLASGNWQVEVLAASRNSWFTAVTHVWADGLGNHSNFVLCCILLRH
ncbi:MAG: hypothetical protein OHK93_001597 [Ramalina farinacea]|uniref:Uncharacterized protein n=1 Tax=Ramalina farinacea TaxID=258253 RepID=A0AA43TXV9_9LECA|nr:hypothetical protein [Ramalina farinacea]